MKLEKLVDSILARNDNKIEKKLKYKQSFHCFSILIPKNNIN